MALSLIGASADEVTGAVCHKFICPAEEGQCPVTDLGQDVNSSERALLRKDGSRVPIIKSVIVTELGGKKVLLESFIDITAQKQVEASLRESEKWHRDLITTTSDILWQTNEKARFVYVSPQVEKILGYSQDELIGRCPSEFMEPSWFAASWELFNKAAANPGVMVSADSYWFHKDGHPVILETRALPIFLPDGSCAGFRGIDRDITRRRLAEEELKQLNGKLNLLSGITRHDIGNQLLVLKGHLCLLEDQHPDPVHAAQIRGIAAAADRISGMIAFTREYEKIGASAPVWQDCRTLVDTAAREAVPGPIAVKNDLPYGTELYADPLIARVFYNLIGNAMQHGGKTSFLHFFVDESARTILVCEDDGDGVPADRKEKIFERGFGKHTGLGLFLSREILGITGITIRETGKPGKGARFEMNVPEGAYRRQL
jgi:PAS domain S-box-containing protein